MIEVTEGKAALGVEVHGCEEFVVRRGGVVVSSGFACSGGVRFGIPPRLGNDPHPPESEVPSPDTESGR